MINDITDFLPKYPNIENSKNDILNPYKDSLNLSIFLKKEFYDEKLEKAESLPKEKGDLLKHQKIISRFFSSYTPYDQLLLVHEMGSGKTCAAISAIEKIRNEKNTFTGAIILARGQGLLNNFKNELVFKCTKDTYIPENYENLTEGEKVARTNKLVRQYYTMMTFVEIAKKLSGYTDEIIKELYSNKIIVIDEVHNVRIKDIEEGESVYVYREFERLLHIAKNCKILLMSGTPIKDTIDEFANIINLIVPRNEQFPIKEKFIEDFFDYNSKTEIYKIKKYKEKELKNKLRGRVSYLKAVKSDVKKVFVGEKKFGSLKYFTVFPDYMSDFQSENYSRIYDDDLQGGGVVYLNSRQASLFVYPDGLTGDDSNEYKIIKVEKMSMGKKVNKLIKKEMYTLSPKLLNELKGDNNEEIIKNIAKYSSKYASLITKLLQAIKDNKKSFIYCEYVTGTGAILLSQILNLVGFSAASGNETTKAPRYALINNISSDKNKIKRLIERYNQKDNMYGEYISVVIGSFVIAEGFSLFDVQEEHILTPHWNYSETDQAVARGYRFGSHKYLLEEGIIPELKIYQYVSIPSKKYNTTSIDLKMYEISEVKDINIKHIERLLKEISFDCALNYNRNHITGYDNERDCEYTNCDYYCDDIPKKFYIKEGEESEDEESEDEESEDEESEQEESEDEESEDEESEEESEDEESEDEESEDEESDYFLNKCNDNTGISQDFSTQKLKIMRHNVRGDGNCFFRSLYLSIICSNKDNFYKINPVIRPSKLTLDSRQDINEFIKNCREYISKNYNLTQIYNLCQMHLEEEGPDYIYDIDNPTIAPYGEIGKCFLKYENDYEKFIKCSKELILSSSTYPTSIDIEMITDLLHDNFKIVHIYIPETYNILSHQNNKIIKNISLENIKTLENIKKENYEEGDEVIFYYNNKEYFGTIEEVVYEYLSSDNLYFSTINKIKKDVENYNSKNIDSSKIILYLISERQHFNYLSVEKNKDESSNEESSDEEFIIRKKKIDGYDEPELDISTYQLYYNKNKISKLISSIIDLFSRKYFQLELNTIINIFSDYTFYEIMDSLRNIINFNMIIINKYGFRSYLKEDNNIYYLVDNLSIESNNFSEYYTKNPTIAIRKPFDRILNNLYLKSAPKIIKKLFNMKTIDEIKNVINMLPLDINEVILENSIIANIKNISVNQESRQLILSVFKNDFKELTVDDEKYYISSYLYQNKKILRCLNINNIKNGWYNCDQTLVEHFSSEKRKDKAKLQENKYGGYYGMYSKTHFCIRSPDDKNIVSTDGRKILPGVACGTGKWQKPGLIKLVLDVFKVPIPPENLTEKELKKNKTLWAEIKSLKRNKKIENIHANKYLNYSKETLEETDDDNLNRIYYWSNQQTKQMCERLKILLENEDLLIYNPDCGSYHKDRLSEVDKEKKDKKEKKKKK